MCNTNSLANNNCAASNAAQVPATSATCAHSTTVAVCAKDALVQRLQAQVMCAHARLDATSVQEVLANDTCTVTVYTKGKDSACAVIHVENDVDCFDDAFYKKHVDNVLALMGYKRYTQYVEDSVWERNLIVAITHEAYYTAATSAL